MDKSTSIDIYNQFFGFSERPFTLVPDPDFLYWSKDHRLAFTMLEYGVMTRAPITVITGEVGAGKTTLLQYLLRSLSEDIVTGLISNAQGGRGELLQWILHSLGVNFDAKLSYVELFTLLQDFVLESYARGGRVVLIIDEAQNLNVETLEELRMLTNINSNKDELLQLILVGQPELRELIQRPELRQFAQRVGASFHIKPMSADTMSAYIQHRLQLAGGHGGEFSMEAMDRIFDLTDGVPRLVNQLCDLCLVYAFSAESHIVDAETVEAVVEDQVFFSGSIMDKGVHA
ncbi:MAG: ExeA family protein [Mangrovicoccus sp.]